uniref:HAD-IIB family hydrolase n=1 Tax=Ningiella ruwaisensis TaxID=2364274 RepID=UPI0015D3D479|nr:HAD-IIB family hydrolase [Ningiella ruwaisensis]
MSAAINKHLIIYSDLDGTLLDHYSYSFEPVIQTLSDLKAKNIPVILNTSKTAAEVKEIHKKLNLDTPFIIENGAAVYVPKNAFKTKPKSAVWQDGYWVKTFAPKRSHWKGLLSKLSRDYAGEFEAFSDMSINRICEVTDLPEADARLASKRLFGEPLLWKGSDARQGEFIKKAETLGAKPLRGGRFLHISGDTNKGKAMEWLSEEYKRQWQASKVTTIALGDGNNDVAMLEAADIAVRILSPVHPPVQLQRTDGVITTSKHGPEGWREAIEPLVAQSTTNH